MQIVNNVIISGEIKGIVFESYNTRNQKSYNFNLKITDGAIIPVTIYNTEIVNEVDGGALKLTEGITLGVVGQLFIMPTVEKDFLFKGKVIVTNKQNHRIKIIEENQELELRQA